MTRIVNGYAQPDIEATKDNETELIFVETSQSMNKLWAKAVKKTCRWLKQNRPNVQLTLIVTKPRKSRKKNET